MQRKKMWFVLVALWFFFGSINFCAAQSSRTLDGPYQPSDGLKAYQKQTGFKVYRSKNAFDIGWCTWFVAAIYPRQVPMKGPGQNDAANWAQNFQDAGYRLSQKPRVGAIAVWNSSIGNGHGHVAYVTKVYSNDKFEVWDSNWSMNSDRLVRRRLIYASAEPALSSFILPPTLSKDQAWSTVKVWLNLCRSGKEKEANSIATWGYMNVSPQKMPSLANYMKKVLQQGQATVDYMASRQDSTRGTIYRFQLRIDSWPVPNDISVYRVAGKIHIIYIEAP